MTSFSAKKSQKTTLLGEEKTSNSLKWPQKFLNYVLQWYLTGDKKKMHLFLKSGYQCQIKGEKWEKKDISLNISKNFAAIFDHRLDRIKEYN